MMEKAPIKELIANWENNWNQSDAQGLKNMFLEDALLIENDIICKNIHEIDENWIQPNVNLVRGLKVFELQEWSTDDRASYTGTYEVEAQVEEEITLIKGVFTVNWVKTEKQDWKITSSMIHAFLS